MLATSPPLSVVIPCFNERERLPATLDASLAYLCATRGGAWEVIVSCDGSTDGTVDVVRNHHANDRRVRIVRSEQNRGKGAALAAGAAIASGDRILLLDADGGTPLSSLPALEDEMARTRCGLVVGERVRSERRSWRRQLMGTCFRQLAGLCVRPLGGSIDFRKRACN